MEDIDVDGKFVSGRAAEAALHAGRIISTAMGFPIVYGIFGIGTDTPHLWQTLGILAGGGLFETVLILRSALKLMNGELVDKKTMPFARAVAENPSRALYPVSLVHECLLPTARILAHNTIAPTQLLRANK